MAYDFGDLNTLGQLTSKNSNVCLELVAANTSISFAVPSQINICSRFTLIKNLMEDYFQQHSVLVAFRRYQNNDRSCLCDLTAPLA